MSECEECGDEYTLDDECEPTGFCHPCAQSIACGAISAQVSVRDLTIRDLRAENDRLRSAIPLVLVWEDTSDEWSSAIKAAHPTQIDSHDEYAVAMRMVGHRHSKGELVALVTWLLVRLKARP
jgi:hypothetical protein